jgi:hypothetical protein
MEIVMSDLHLTAFGMFFGLSFAAFIAASMAALPFLAYDEIRQRKQRRPR